MDKPTQTAFAPLSPVAATPLLWTMPATRLSGVALRWSADATLPTLLPGRVDLPPGVVVRFAAEGAR